MWRFRMLQKVLVCFLFAITLSACGDNGGTASGKWVGEIYENPNTKASTVVGEYGSYAECLEAVQKASKTGVFNCGVE